jgi:hypothetical protein
MEVTRVKVLARSIFLMVVGAGGVSWAAGSGKSPLEELPPYIRQVTHFGERADWSHDGRRLLFLEKTFGDGYEVELATGIIRPMTQHIDLYKLALDGTGRTERSLGMAGFGSCHQPQRRAGCPRHPQVLRT